MWSLNRRINIHPSICYQYDVLCGLEDPLRWVFDQCGISCQWHGSHQSLPCSCCLSCWQLVGSRFKYNLKPLPWMLTCKLLIRYHDTALQKSWHPHSLLCFDSRLANFAKYLTHKHVVLIDQPNVLVGKDNVSNGLANSLLILNKLLFTSQLAAVLLAPDFWLQAEMQLAALNLHFLD